MFHPMSGLTLSPKSVSNSVRKDIFPKEYFVMNNIDPTFFCLLVMVTCEPPFSMTSSFFVSLPQCDTISQGYWRHGVCDPRHQNNKPNLLPYF